MVNLKRTQQIIKRLVHHIFNRHKYTELTLIRYCPGCAWIEQKDRFGEWGMVKEENSTWWTSKQMIKASEELQEAIFEIEKIWGRCY